MREARREMAQKYVEVAGAGQKSIRGGYRVPKARPGSALPEVGVEVEGAGSLSVSVMCCLDLGSPTPTRRRDAVQFVESPDVRAAFSDESADKVCRQGRRPRLPRCQI